MSTGPSPSPNPGAAPAARKRRKVEVGVVTRDKTTKTRRVEVERLVPHPKYGKFQRRRTICYAHDETDSTRIGDLVEIMATRPLSKTKRWRITRVVRPGSQRPLAGESGPPQAPTPDEPSAEG
jgi:small subunit ribosomal protein S17